MGLFDGGLGGLFGGGGGGFSGGGIGSSANTTTNETTNQNNATSGDNSAVYDTRGGALEFNVNTLDAGAIDRVFDFASDYVGRAAESTANVLDSYSAQSREAFSELVKFSTEANKSGVQQLTESVFKYGLLALVGVAAVAAFAYSRKKAA